MPRCYMCPPPLSWSEVDYTTEPCFVPWKNKVLCCDDTSVSLPLRRRRLEPTWENLETLLQKLVNHLDVINEEMKVFVKFGIVLSLFLNFEQNEPRVPIEEKVSEGMRGCLRELREEILCNRDEAVVRLPRYVRSNAQDSTSDGVDLNRGAALMTRKQMFITLKKLKAQHSFLQEQFAILTIARKELVKAIACRRNLLIGIGRPGGPVFDEKEHRLGSSPPTGSTKFVEDGKSIPIKFGIASRPRTPITPKVCSKECQLRAVYEMCTEALRTVREAVKMSNFRRGKIAGIVHEMFRLYSRNNQLESSPLKFGRYYGVGCGGGVAVRRKPFLIM